MRILIISDVSGYMVGGVPIETVQLIRGLSGRGHEIALAGDVVPAGGEAAKHYRIGLPVRRVLSVELRRIIASFQPDCVHVMAMSSRGIHWLGSVLNEGPWTFTCHSLPPHERKLAFFHGNEKLHYGTRFLRCAPNIMAWKWLFKGGKVPHVVVHSLVTQNIVTDYYGHSAHETALIPLGCEVTEGTTIQSQPVSLNFAPRLLTIGALAHSKGQHDVIEAIATLRREFPGIHYRIIGEIRDRSYLGFLEQRITELRLSAHVLITPNASQEEKQGVLATTDVYVQPSHEEGFCLAYLEGAAMVPRLVGCDTGAIALISRSDPAMRVVRARSPRSLAEALLDVLRAPLPSDLMERRIIRLRKKFSWKPYLDAHETLYAELMARHTVRSGMHQ